MVKQRVMNDDELEYGSSDGSAGSLLTGGVSLHDVTPPMSYRLIRCCSKGVSLHSAFAFELLVTENIATPVRRKKRLPTFKSSTGVASNYFS